METKVLEERLASLGFENASNKLKSDLALAEKMELAYSKYLYVSQAQFDAFNEKLKAETLQEDKRAYTYKRLKFTDIKNYTKIPPENVLDSLEKAKEDNIFDVYEICEIEWHEEIKDPILFGYITGCTDKFFISQWEEDIKIEDILFMEKKENANT